MLSNLQRFSYSDKGFLRLSDVVNFNVDTQNFGTTRYSQIES